MRGRATGGGARAATTRPVPRRAAGPAGGSRRPHRDRRVRRRAGASRTSCASRGRDRAAMVARRHRGLRDWGRDGHPWPTPWARNSRAQRFPARRCSPRSMPARRISTPTRSPTRRRSTVIWLVAGTFFALDAAVSEQREPPTSRACGTREAFGLMRLLVGLPHHLARSRVPLITWLLEAGFRKRLACRRAGPRRYAPCWRGRWRARVRISPRRQLLGGIPRAEMAAFLPLALVDPNCRLLKDASTTSLGEIADIAPLRRGVAPVVGASTWAHLAQGAAQRHVRRRDARPCAGSHGCIFCCVSPCSQRPEPARPTAPHVARGEPVPLLQRSGRYGGASRHLAGAPEDRRTPVLGAEQALSARHEDGWAATMYRKTCWNTSRNRHLCPEGRGYINPAHHQVIVELQGVEDAGTVACSWLTAPKGGRGQRGQVLVQPCHQPVRLAVPYRTVSASRSRSAGCRSSSGHSR